MILSSRTIPLDCDRVIEFLFDDGHAPAWFNTSNERLKISLAVIGVVKDVMKKRHIEGVLWNQRIIRSGKIRLQVSHVLFSCFLLDVIQQARPDIDSQSFSTRRNSLGKRNGKSANAAADVGNHVARLQFQAGDYIVNPSARGILSGLSSRRIHVLASVRSWCVPAGLFP